MTARLFPAVLTLAVATAAPGRAQPFEDVTERAGLKFTHQLFHDRIANILLSNGAGGAVLDFDNDGFVDVYLVNWAPLDGVTSPKHPGPRAPNRLFRNRGDGTFEDVTRAAGLYVPGHRAMSVSAFDADQDGDTDLYISNDDTPNMLWLNDGQGRFREVAIEVGVAFNSIGEAPGSMNAAVADFNGDGLMDLFITRLGYGSLYLRNARGLYDDRMFSSGLGRLTQPYVGWGGVALDFDNDGDADLFVANGDAFVLPGTLSLLLENDGRANFTDAAAKGGPFFQRRINGRGAAVLDFNNDGRPDLLLTTLGGPAILLQNRGAPGHWLTLDLEGTRSNRSGYGTLITLIAGGRTWKTEALCPTGFLMQGDKRVHLGLGGAARVDRLELRWLSGQTQVLTNLAVDRILKITEPR